MAASTQLIADITTFVANGPNAATTARAIAASGYIEDYLGNSGLLLTKLKEAKIVLALVISETSNTDTTNLALLNGIQAAVSGTSSPSSHVLTDIATVIAAGPNAATQANAISITTAVVDYSGELVIIQNKLKESKVVLNALVYDTDSTDSTNLTLLQNVGLTLS